MSFRKAVPRLLLRLFDREKARHVSLIEGSGLFDVDWYLQEYPDVARSSVDPLLHYLDFGAGELRDPGPSFSTSWYASAYPEVGASGQNPLIHYLTQGRAQGFTAVRPRVHVPWWEEKSRERGRGAPFEAGFLGRMTEGSKPVVVVPLGDDGGSAERCLASLRVSNDLGASVVVVFDPSQTDLAQRLAAQTDDLPWIEFCESSAVSGPSGLISLVAKLANGSDLLILDSAAVVSTGWMRNLKAAVRHASDVGCAVPLDAALPAGELSDAARAVSQLASREYPPLPSGALPSAVYIRGACIAGLREDGALGSGDLRMKMSGLVDCISRQGMRCVLDDATLLARPEEAIDRDASVAADVNHCGSGTASEALQVASTAPGEVRPRILYVLSTKQGGTPQTNRDLMSALGGHAECFVLHSNAASLSLAFFDGEVLVELESRTLPSPIEALPHRSGLYDEWVMEWLLRHAIELVHVRHIAWHSLGLIDAAKMLGLPVIFSFHDFYAVCPTVKLLDENNVHCGGRCTATPGDCIPELWEPSALAPLKNASIYRWRDMFEDMLSRCDAFVTTSVRAKALLESSFPFLASRQFSIIPHGRDFAEMNCQTAALAEGEPLRLLVPGGISIAKGGKFLEELARSARPETLEIHVLGTVAEEISLPRHVHVHGPYLREEVVSRIAAIRPHLGAVLSSWPETYCHTLTELWAAGVPVVAFDIGAVGERIEESGAGWLVPMSVEAMLDFLHRLRSQPEEWGQVNARLAAWQQLARREHTCRVMGDAYLDLYESLLPALR